MIALLKKTTSTLAKIIKPANQFANRYEGLLLLLGLVILLRLPTLFEPYWYGDEAIYLTIGHALNQGQDLYAQIVDHKTPLIYYLASVPNQLWFRILIGGWLLASTILFHQLAKQIMATVRGKPWSTYFALAATTIFVLLTNLPALEGNIPNGELFVIGFVLLALRLLSCTAFWKKILQPQNKLKVKTQDYFYTFLAGLSLSLGLLTKVPALLDIAALGSVFLWLVILGFWPLKNGKLKPLWQPLLGGIVLVIGISLPVIASIIYYAAQGNLEAYLQFGLLYNLHYAGNWTVPIEQAWLQSMFNLPVKVMILAIGGLLAITLTFKKQKSLATLWLGWWFWLTLFGSLLSNRPYPHYYQQLVPALSLLLPALLAQQKAFLQKTFAILGLLLALAAFALLDFRPYGTWEYYQHFFRYATGQISAQQYTDQFNYLVSENRKLLPYIQAESQPSEPIFIWGTNPMLYAQSQRFPASRFTVAFHIHDLQNYDETLQEIKNYQPPLIVVMKDEQPWKELNQYLAQNYSALTETNYMVLYKRISLDDFNQPELLE